MCFLIRHVPHGERERECLLGRNPTREDCLIGRWTTWEMLASFHERKLLTVTFEAALLLVFSGVNAPSLPSERSWCFHQVNATPLISPASLTSSSINQSVCLAISSRPCLWLHLRPSSEA